MVAHIFSNHITISLTILIILTTISHKYNGATLTPDESYVTKLTSPKPTHFVLVHGACHGGWSWYKVRALLESAGHKVSSPDLTSAGIDPSDANAIFTFQEYNKPVHDILTSLPEGEKVIIAGHSSGGISVSDAIQNFPEKILVGIYVVGEMQRKNSSHSEQEIVAEEPYLAKFTGLELLVDVFDYFYGQGRDNPPTSAIFKKEVQHELLYSKSPLEDSTLAAMLLKPCPIRAMNKITDGSIQLMSDMTHGCGDAGESCGASTFSRCCAGYSCDGWWSGNCQGDPTDQCNALGAQCGLGKYSCCGKLNCSNRILGGRCE